VAVLARASGTDSFNLVLDLYDPRFLKAQLTLQPFTLFQRLLQVHEHDVVSAGLQLDRLTRRYL
jgi:hypothetical protein